MCHSFDGSSGLAEAGVIRSRLTAEDDVADGHVADADATGEEEAAGGATRAGMGAATPSPVTFNPDR